jgi:hypothetical protein
MARVKAIFVERFKPRGQLFHRRTGSGKGSIMAPRQAKRGETHP